MAHDLSRRAFVTGAAAAGFTAGCNVNPYTDGFAAWSWAEQLNERIGAAFGYPLAKEYGPEAATQDFPVRSLTLPPTYAESLAGWTLTVDGLVTNPKRYTMEELRAAFIKRGAVTRHDCVEGWSAIAGWAGVRLSDLLDEVQPTPEAEFVVFYAADFEPNGNTPYYGSIRLRDARHPQTVLAYEMNGEPLPLDHGAPLRLKVPTQLGYKSTKFIHRVSFVSKLQGIGAGRGGYWEDFGYEHWAGI
jgi:DMSO/TMAO reductase YedYZ molybdopterin-dependent catalytic subunit